MTSKHGGTSPLVPQLTNLSHGHVPDTEIGDDAVVIPSYSSWFSFSEIHEIERKNFPELLGSENPEDVRTYVEYRNFMINSFRTNRHEYLTVTACRRMLAGSVGTLIKIHTFLEQWGLINYRLDFRPDKAKTSQVFLQGPRTIRPSQPGKPKTDLNLYPNTMESKDIHCATCGVTCTLEYYHCLKQPSLGICKPCFSEGRFSSQFYSADFVKLSIQQKEEDWTDQEQLYLLEGIEMHGEDWDAIAKHVGTKTREECITKFIELPIQDPYLEDSVGDSGVPFLSNENPIMSLVCFLASMVHPNIASAAAKAAIKEYEIICKSEAYEPETEFGSQMQASETMERVARVVLDSAKQRSEELVREEDQRLESYMALIVETHISKLETKMRRFEELEQHLVDEKRQLEKQRILLAEERSKLTGLVDNIHNRKEDFGPNMQEPISPVSSNGTANSVLEQDASGLERHYTRL